MSRFSCLLWLTGCTVSVTFDPAFKDQGTEPTYVTTFPAEDDCEGLDIDEDGIPPDEDEDDDGDGLFDWDDEDPCDPEIP